MSNVTVHCSNCGNPTPTGNVDSDGQCGRCSNVRISASPPKPGKAPTNVATAARKSFDTSQLYREPVKSKIPIADHMRRLARRGEVAFPLPPAMPREAEGLSST